MHHSPMELFPAPIPQAMWHCCCVADMHVFTVAKLTTAGITVATLYYAASVACIDARLDVVWPVVCLC